MQLGRYGVWVRADQVEAALAAEVEALGFGCLWIGGSPGGELTEVDEALAATSSLTVATGIVNIWKDDAAPIARTYHRVEAAHPGRFLLGIGVGHPEATRQYAKPYESLVRYLDELDAHEVPVQRRILAALGPKVLALAAERTAGAHPYLVPPEHTALARAVMGPDALLAPEHKIVLEADPVRARGIGRPPVQTPYLGLRNYVSNLERLGWTADQIADGGSDALIDALVAHGTPEAVRDGLEAHHRAGADHVAVQVLTAPGGSVVATLRELAGVLTL